MFQGFPVTFFSLFRQLIEVAIKTDRGDVGNLNTLISDVEVTLA